VPRETGNMAKDKKPTKPATAPIAKPPPPPRRSNIRVTQQAEEESGRGYSGNYLFKDTVTPMKAYWPPKEDKKVSPSGRKKAPPPAITTFRCLPEPVTDPDDPEAYIGQFHPARHFDENGVPDLSGWIERHMTFRIPSLGKDRDTSTRGGAHFAIFDSATVVDPHAKWDTPAFLLMNGLRKAVQADEGPRWWAKLIAKSQGALKWPNWTYAAYAALYQHGSPPARSRFS
jgi:hypothetical protein